MTTNYGFLAFYFPSGLDPDRDFTTATTTLTHRTYFHPSWLSFIIKTFYSSWLIKTFWHLHMQWDVDEKKNKQ